MRFIMILIDSEIVTEKTSSCVQEKSGFGTLNFWGIILTKGVYIIFNEYLFIYLFI